MYFGNKKYFIEVIQCSGEEMNLVLLGLLPSNLMNAQQQTAVNSSNRYMFFIIKIFVIQFEFYVKNLRKLELQLFLFC